MPNFSFFQRMGVFALKDFLDAESCHAIQAQMHLPQSIRPAEISRDGMERIDEAIRKTKLVKIDKQTKSSIEERVTSIKSQIKAHFEVELDTCENPQFLAYKEGDFFKPHTDSITSSTAHDFVQQRRVSVVLFLNGESSIPSPDTYSGSSLILFFVKAEIFELPELNSIIKTSSCKSAT